MSNSNSAQHTHSRASFTFAGTVALAEQARAERAEAAKYPAGSIGRVVATRIAQRCERQVRERAKAAMSDLAAQVRKQGGAA